MRQFQGILLLFAYISVYPQQDTSLILSEIMFIPQSGNNEFVEIYNSSSETSINLSGYRIKYYTASADIITDAGWGTVLPPLSYAVIFEGDYDFNSGIYNNIVPPSALKLKISDNSFGATGMSNTSDRLVQFLDSSSNLIDQRFYTADNPTGYSEEKIALNRDSLNHNWCNSEYFNGTPGSRNSVSPLGNDLSLFSLFITPSLPAAGTDILVNAVIKNKGSNTAPSFSCSFYNDINFDSIPSPGELIRSEVFYNLPAGDSLTAQALMSSIPHGTYNLIAKIFFVPDEDTVNNVKFKNFTVYAGSEIADVIINEIMYAPSGGMPEWVELYNRSGNQVNLKNRKISDNTSSVYITRNDFFLPADSFVVLCKDSSLLSFIPVQSKIIELHSLPSFNNSGDDIVIRDSAGIHFDSLSYLPEWGGTSGRSLERISSEGETNNPQNWGTSAGLRKATPGWINSLTPKLYDLKIDSFAVIPYGIIGEEIKLCAEVINSGTFLSGSFAVRFYADRNKDSTAQSDELIITINNNPLMPSDSLLIWINYSTFTEGTNYIIVTVEVTPDEDLTNNIAFTKFTGVIINEIRSDLVINEIMYAPKVPEREWVEILNRSTKTIQLQNYCLADNNDTVKINTSSYLLQPSEFVIVSSDSSILNLYKTDAVLFCANIPALNNTGDKVLLMDSLYRIIDSLEYRSSWGINYKSIERIDINGSSTDSLNWSVCLSRNGGTPGGINSVSAKEHDVKINSLTTSPRYPVRGDTVAFRVGIRNTGNKAAEFTLNFYKDENLDSLPDLLLEKIPGFLIEAHDSSTVSLNYKINNLQQLSGYLTAAVYPDDQDTSNNNIYSIVFPGFSPGSLLINEIMYSPQGGEPEWIELINMEDETAGIKGWKISDVFSTPSIAEITEDIYIPSGSFYVLSKDSSIQNYHRVIPSGFSEADLPVLNNDRDGIVLYDNRGQVIDSLIYLSYWGGSGGLSLERKSTSVSSHTQTNWGSSKDIENSTPGRLNTLTPKENDLAAGRISFIPEYPVLHDSVSVSVIVQNYGTLPAEEFTVKFYFRRDSSGYSDSLLSEITGKMLQSDDSVTLASAAGIVDLDCRYIISAEVISGNDMNIYNNLNTRTVEPGAAANTVVINELMYFPPEGESEWIEFINVSSSSINLKGWEIEDISSGSRASLTEKNCLIEPGEYFVAAYDTSFWFAHPSPDYKVFPVQISSLGNISDGIILYDFRNGIIDKLLYKSAWGGKNGYSLERISVNRSTQDSSNWATCLSSIKRSTPGAINSVDSIVPRSRNDVIINEILADPDIDNCEFIELLNLTSDTINTGGWRIEDGKGKYHKLSDTSSLLAPSGFFLIAADSILLTKYKIPPECSMNIKNESALGLINAGEKIILKDIFGNIIDSVEYSDNWHNRFIKNRKNISLEKLNPRISSNNKSNWSSSLSPEGATPGKANSIFCENPDYKSSISVNPNPFSPDNDGFEDHCIINYKLQAPVSGMRIKIFDSQGRPVRTLLNNQISGYQGSVIFDGLNDDGHPLRIGIYIIYMEALNEFSGKAEILKSLVVIARKLN